MTFWVLVMIFLSKLSWICHNAILLKHYPVWVYFKINYTLSLVVHNPMLYMVYRFYCSIKGECIFFFTGAGSRDGSMGLWEISEEVLSQAEKHQNEKGVPSYSHISHRALKDIPKEYTHPYNCKVRALAFNNSHKVSGCLWLVWLYWLKMNCVCALFKLTVSPIPLLSFSFIH